MTKQEGNKGSQHLSNDNKVIWDVIYLVSCALNASTPEPVRIKAMDMDKVLSLASRHSITAMVAFALESAGFRSKQTMEAIAMSLRRTACFDEAWKILKPELEKAGIWYMPLKGAVLKNDYPKYGMREFADHDILFDANRHEDVRHIMEDSGFTVKQYGTGAHDSYYKPPFLYFEMHRALFRHTQDSRIYEYYQDVDKRLQGDGLEKYFSPEDFYLYFLAHEYKHYSNSGTGLRSLVDTYVILHKYKFDMAYVNTEAAKLGIADFEAANRSLALRLFSNEELSPSDHEMFECFLFSGTYGSIEKRVDNTLKNNGWSKSQYIWKRILIPVSKDDPLYQSFATAYPTFYKHKILLPLLPFYRILRVVKSDRLRKEARALIKAKCAKRDGSF